MPEIVQKKNKKTFYLNDAKLKAPGVDLEWTPSEIAEYKKCHDNINYFIEKFVKIVNIDRGIVPFKLYPYQKKVINIYKDNRFVLQKWGRQSGKCLDFSTTINIRNKNTGVCEKITIGEFYERERIVQKCIGFLNDIR